MSPVEVLILVVVCAVLSFLFSLLLALFSAYFFARSSFSCCRFRSFSLSSSYCNSQFRCPSFSSPFLHFSSGQPYDASHLSSLSLFDILGITNKRMRRAWDTMPKNWSSFISLLFSGK